MSSPARPLSAVATDAAPQLMLNGNPPPPPAVPVDVSLDACAVVRSVDVLFAAAASGSALDAVAVLVNCPLAFTVVMMVTNAVCPGASVPILQVTVAPLLPHEPRVCCTL